MPPTSTSSPNPGPYSGWTREKLIERLMQLEHPSQLPPPPPPLPTPGKTFDFSKHSRRKIALKFCYSGWEYGGLAFQMIPTPLPTVENVLFDVLSKTHLIDPDAGFEGCGWERCGRTDRGVSAAGQVVSLWVRSNLPSEQEGESTLVEGSKTNTPDNAEEKNSTESDSGLLDEFGPLDISQETSSTTAIPAASSTSQTIREHDYLAVMNRLLPDTIRVIAWSPVSESFSARFSCKYRHYKYFFSSHNLDIDLMKAAAARLVGEHDFRNLCKLDVQKQITSFRRKILLATIELVETDDQTEGMHVFDLIGTAFLYHQVRHIMAVLFLVGSGLEHPSVVTQLMNVDNGTESIRSEDESIIKTYAVVDRRPEYQMADALPLMLWECGYDESELNWCTTNWADEENREIFRTDLYTQLQAIYLRSRVFSCLDQHFLKAVQKYHRPPPFLSPLNNRLLQKAEGITQSSLPMNVPLGGGTFKRTLKYTPLLDRKRLDTVDVMNERWRLGKGSRREEKRKAEQGEPNEGDE